MLTSIQYSPNHQKSNFFKNWTKKYRLKYPKINDDTNNPIPSTVLIASKPEEKSNSYTIERIIIGITIKKQYWIDFSLFNPNIKAELITIPDLEIPGRMATDWKSPKSNADLRFKSKENEFLRRLMKIIKNPFAINEYWTKL